MKIHISNSAKDALDQLGGYHVEYRGNKNQIKIQSSYFE